MIASMQPLHTTPNDNNLNVWAGNVGPERAQRAWPWRDILAGGATIVLRQRLAGRNTESLAGCTDAFKTGNPGGNTVRGMASE